MLQLPGNVMLGRSQRNGETLATDEASVWKRVLNYRLARILQPKSILETHPGLGISTKLYILASPRSKIHNLSDRCDSRSFDLVDVDPFGQPWDSLQSVLPHLSSRGVIMVTSGEIQAVVRRLTKAQRFKTPLFGKKTPEWVQDEHVPRLEYFCNAKAVFYYAFPTSVRVFLARRAIPDRVWKGCRRWMWWLNRYAPSS
jgi:hypothetical protein